MPSAVLVFYASVVRAEGKFHTVNVIILEEWKKFQYFSKVLISPWQDGRPSVGPMTAHSTAPHEEANPLQVLSRTWPIGHRGAPDSKQWVPRTGMLRPCVPFTGPSGLYNTLPFCCHPNGTLRWELNLMTSRFISGVLLTPEIFLLSFNFRCPALKIRQFYVSRSPEWFSSESLKTERKIQCPRK